MRLALVIGWIALATAPLFADALPDYPILVEQLPNPNDYSLFANAGWDGNWYVGYNTCWIKKLPPVPAGSFSRAYLGVKLGRAKAANNSQRPWEKEPIPGEIFAAVSSTTAWNARQQILLAQTSDLPLDGDPENAVSDVGESEWLWASVPIGEVNLHGDNYVALWSPTPTFISVSSSPVLAAGWGGKEVDSWLVHDIRGAPPRIPIDPNPGISYFQPAIALKLIPANVPPHRLSVRLIGWTPGTPAHLRPVLSASVDGQDVERVWVEALAIHRGASWKKIGRPLWKAPFIFSLDLNRLPSGNVKLRVVAANLWEEETASEPFNVTVSSLPARS